MRPTNAKLILLCVATVAFAVTAGVSWRIGRHARELRSDIADLSKDRHRLVQQVSARNSKRADLYRQIAEAGAALDAVKGSTSVQHADADNAELLERISVLRARAVSRVERGELQNRTPPSGPHGNVYFPELFADPHYAQVYMAWQRHQTANRYAPLLSALSLSPNDRAQFKELLVQKEMAYQEVDGILESQAMLAKKPVERIAAMRVKREVLRTFEEEMKRRFGDEVFDRFRMFENGAGARQELVGRLALRLSYSPMPLSGTQEESLIRLVSSSDGSRGRQDVITDDLITKARSILQPSQIAGLLELNEEMQAARGSSVSIHSDARPQ